MTDKEIKADNYVSNHKDSEVRRMYGHHCRSYIAGYEEADQQNKALLKENSKLVQTVAEWSALAIDRKQDLDALLKEVEDLRSYKNLAKTWVVDQKNEITNLKKQLQEKKREAKVLVNTINEVWNEENGSVQMHTPIAWYRVLRLININS